MRTTIAALILVLASSFVLSAQVASRGVILPFTVSGSMLVSDRPRAADPTSGRVRGGFRAVFYPSLKISPAWFVYSAVQVNSEPFFYYEAFYPKTEIEAGMEQLYLGYTHLGENAAFNLKVGKLPAAFGSFPLRYDDTSNPLLDQPPAYAYPVRLRPDQLPCGTDDLTHQQTYPIYVTHYCGGSTEERNGMIPVTLYGLAGIEADIGWRRLDARIQLTNSSPTNPQSLTSESQHLQWTAGGGYTPWQGFRIGISAFHGPFLEDDVRSLLPSGTTVADYPAVGIGTDIQWGRGPWTINAEWHRIRYRYPGFQTPPALDSGYLEIRTILSPRFYLALRAGYSDHGRVEDDMGVVANSFLPDSHSWETAVGYHVNRSHLLKFGYERLKTPGVSGTRDDVFGVQFVTSVYSLSKAF